MHVHLVVEDMYTKFSCTLFVHLGGGAIGPQRDVHKVQLYNVCSFGGPKGPQSYVYKSSVVQCLFI